MAALKRAVPRGGSVKVVTSSADVSSPRAHRAREKDVDLRAIINQSREERTEMIRCVEKDGDVGGGGGGGGGDIGRQGPTIHTKRKEEQLCKCFLKD